MPGGAVTAVIGAAAVGAGVASAWVLAPALHSVSPLARAGYITVPRAMAPTTAPMATAATARCAGVGSRTAMAIACCVGSGSATEESYNRQIRGKARGKQTAGQKPGRLLEMTRMVQKAWYCSAGS